MIAAVGGVVFLGFALKVFASKAGDLDMEAKDRKLALGMFAFSILYLALLFGALIVEHGFGLYFSSPNLAIWAGV